MCICTIIIPFSFDSLVSVSSLQAQVLKLQNESHSLRNELASVRHEHDSKDSKRANGTPTKSNIQFSPNIMSTRQRREKMTETEARILEVEMRLKRQLSLSELGNLAKMAETELINSKLNAKIGELESALRHAQDACAHADAERARVEAKMDDSDKIVKQMSGRIHDLEDRLQDAKRGYGGGVDEEAEREMKAKVQALEEVVKKREDEIRKSEGEIKKKDEEGNRNAEKVVSLESKVQQLEDLLKASKSNEDKLAKDKLSIERKISTFFFYY